MLGRALVTEGVCCVLRCKLAHEDALPDPQPMLNAVDLDARYAGTLSGIAPTSRGNFRVCYCSTFIFLVSLDST